MTFIPSTECGYKKLCDYTIDTQSDIVKSQVKHSINHDYTVDFHGITIPVLVTKRTFSISNTIEYIPVYQDSGLIINAEVGFDGGIRTCTERTDKEAHTASISEDCVIEKSTLAYIDQRRKVCLYRYEKQWVKFYVNTADTCEWRTRWGTVITNKVVIKKQGVNSGKLVEWRLVIDGSEETLRSETDNKWHPFGESSQVEKSDGTMTDPDILMILSIGQPPSESLPYDLDIKALGFYDYGNLPGEESLLNRLDGGNKDYFYPEWCRNLHNDPIWREIADNRYMISWFHAEAVQNKDWYPPEINTDPMPRGNHIYHPTFGDLWQWLLPEKDNSIFVANNIEFIDDLLDKALAENGITTTGTKLYYPIGVL